MNFLSRKYYEWRLRRAIKAKGVGALEKILEQLGFERRQAGADCREYVKSDSEGNESKWTITESECPQDV